jgi:hypothetical protein
MRTKSFYNWIYALAVLGFCGLFALGRSFQFGEWFDALPLRLQGPAGIAAMLVGLVLPFAGMVWLMERLTNAPDDPPKTKVLKGQNK